MQLEFHQLDRRWEHLRVREPHRQRRLLASLADSGQQTPIVVVAAGSPDCYLVIDGHKRVAAMEQLGRDTVEATVWAMSEAEALLPSRSLRFGPPESALEQGWLLAEMEQRFGYGLEELARLFDRSRGGDFRRGVHEYGLPLVIHTDNGVPFASPPPGGLPLVHPAGTTGGRFYMASSRPSAS